MSIKVKYELGTQPIESLWTAARQAKNSSVTHKDADQFKIYIQTFVQTAFKAGREFQRNLKDDKDY